MKDLINKLETIVIENNAKRIISIKIKLGALSHISPEHFREYFAVMSKGKAMENARLEIEVIEDINSNAQDIILESVELEMED